MTSQFIKAIALPTGTKPRGLQTARGIGAVLAAAVAMLQVAAAPATKPTAVDFRYSPPGIWDYFGSFYGHAWLWQGNGAKAAQVLTAFANHAAPTLVWREEQSLVGEKFNKVGDMPHNWASAEFIRLTVHLLALDRGDELHLLEGLPREWTGPGMVTRLNGVATPFGPLNMTLELDQEGKTATLSVRPLARNCKAVVVHLPNGSTQRISPQTGGRIRFPVVRGMGVRASRRVAQIGIVAVTKFTGFFWSPSCLPCHPGMMKMPYQSRRDL